MKIVFGILVLASSLSVFAQSSAVFTVSVATTIEEDVEAALNSKAANSCNGLSAKRVSSIRSNYRPYLYYIAAWADYICAR